MIRCHNVETKLQLVLTYINQQTVRIKKYVTKYKKNLSEFLLKNLESHMSH